MVACADPYCFGASGGTHRSDGKHRRRPIRLHAFLTLVMLTRLRHAVEPPAAFVARLFLRLGFSPNGLTLLTLFVSGLACLLFLWNRNAVLFGTLMIVFGLFDSVDGALARISHRVTKFGSYLDALCDRLFETAAALVVAWVSGYWLLSFLLISGALLISYAKARAAMEIPISNNEWPDLMERTERGLIFAFGVIAWGLYPKPVFGQDLLFWMLAVLNVLVYATLIQRFFRARRLIRSRT